MPGDELEHLRLAVETNSQLDPSLIALQQQWRSMMFSDSSLATLQRYFQYQLAVISKTLAECGKTALLELIDHLWAYYGDYLTGAVIVPPAYQARWLGNNRSQIETLIGYISRSGWDLCLRRCLCDHLRGGAGSDTLPHVTYTALRYLDLLVRRLSVAFDQGLTEIGLHLLLGEMNFNNLSYFAYLQRAYRSKTANWTDPEKLDYYTGELKQWREQPEQSRWIYHPDWPSLRTMLIHFLAEEIHFLQSSPLNVDATTKIPLNLSAAQLACLLRMLVEEDCFGEINLQELFKHFARYFRTKRQNNLSHQSLSKEYYSISQVSAAVLRDKLLKMAARITRNFFPG